MLCDGIFIALPDELAQPRQPTRFTRADLVDETGLKIGRRSRKGKKSTSKCNAGAATALPLCDSESAFAQRKRMIELWLQACGTSVAVHTIEHTVCTGELLGADAEQNHLVVSGLQTPMGTYPSAMLRVSDLLLAELRGPWELSCALPERPAWVDAVADEELNGDEKTPRGSTGAATHSPGPAACGDETVADDATAAAAATGGDDDSAAPVASDLPDGTTLSKYYVQRYMLFSRYDDGCQLDEEGWYSVTPEVLARHMAARCRCDLIIDAFTGVGGNAIQFAYESERVYAIDLDAHRLSLARHNASVYGVDERVEWIHGDFLALAPLLKADVVFLSPPWGGPEYVHAQKFDLVTMMGGLDGEEVLRTALRVAPNVAYYLPRNADMQQVERLAQEAGVSLEVERCTLNGHEKGLMAYFGFEPDEDEA